MGTIMGYILLMLLLAFTLFNIYALGTKKKRDQNNEAKYNALFAPIDNEILKLGKDWKGNPTSRLITDKEEGIVCVRDDNRKRAVIAWDGDLRVFKFTAFNGAEIEEDDNGLRILVHIEGETITLVANSSKFKKKSFVYKTVKSMAEGFVSFLMVMKGSGDKEKTEEAMEESEAKD